MKDRQGYIRPTLSSTLAHTQPYTLLKEIHKKYVQDKKWFYHGGKVLNIEIIRLRGMWIAAGLLGLCVTANNKKKNPISILNICFALHLTFQEQGKINREKQINCEL